MQTGILDLPLWYFIIIIFLHGLGRLNCSGIEALPPFPKASTISSSSRFVVEGVFRESGVVNSFKMVDGWLWTCHWRNRAINYLFKIKFFTIEKRHSSESVALCGLNTRIEPSGWQSLPGPRSGTNNFKFLCRDQLREWRVFG